MNEDHINTFTQLKISSFTHTIHLNLQIVNITKNDNVANNNISIHPLYHFYKLSCKYPILNTFDVIINIVHQCTERKRAVHCTAQKINVHCHVGRKLDCPNDSEVSCQCCVETISQVQLKYSVINT